MLTKTEAKIRVRRGSDAIRKIDPDWFKKINKPLVLYCPNSCVLGQVFGFFNNGFLKVFGDVGWLTGQTVEDHGFDVADYEDYSVLKDEWIKFIDYLKSRNL